jgi:DNA polymerase-3 subunit beta
MKITASSQELNKALQLVSKVLPSNPTMPILKYFLFEVEGTTATITATDLELTAKVRAVLDEVDENFKIAIEGERLINLLKQFPDEPVTLEVKEINEEEGSYYSKQVFLTTIKSKYSLLADEADNFPKVSFLSEEDEDVNSFSLPSYVIKRGFQTTFFAISDNSSKVNLHGLFFDFKGDHINFVSTDVQRLVVYRYDLEIGLEDKNFILPFRSVAFIKALNIADDDVKVIFNEKNVMFKYANVEVISQLVDAKFPNYEGVMQLETQYYINIDRVEFIDALKRVNIVSDQSSHYVEVQVNGEEIVIHGKDLEFLVQGEERLRAETNIESMKIGFNGKLLASILSNLDSTIVTMKLADVPSKPVKFLPFESEDEKEKIEMLLVTMLTD